MGLPIQVAGVDPRVCGGALNSLGTKVSAGGRSPRVRGSRLDHRLRLDLVGSIPACAGEPAMGIL